MSTKLTYTGAEVQELLDKIEKGDFDNAKTLEGHPASYFAIESEFTSLAESFATEQGRVNTLYSYFNNGSANDALRLGGQLPSYYATATQYEILQQALSDFKSLFDSMFEKDSEGNIHAKLSLWSSGGITAGGVGSGGSGGGGGISYSRLDSWADYSADKAGYVLSALLGKDLDNRVYALANAGYITQSALAPYALRSEIPSLVGYATQSWVGNNYLSKSGGTLSGSNRDLLRLDTLNTSGPRITLHENGNLIALIGCVPKQTTTDYGAYFVNVSSKFGVILGNDKKAYITLNTDTMSKDYQILHSGNYSDLLAGGSINGTLSVKGLTAGTTLLAYTGDSNVAHLHITNKSDAIDYVHLFVSNSDKSRKDRPLVLQHEYGNVAIGGKTADAKLHVYGNGKFTGALTANSLTIGGATITYDSVNNALCINGNMYALGGITAGGAGISAYSSLESRVARLEQQLNIS